MRIEAKPAGTSGGQRLLATDWKPRGTAKNTFRGVLRHTFRGVLRHTFRGTFSIITPYGLKIKGVALHEFEDDRWFVMPGEYCTLPNGSTDYVEIVEFENPEAQSDYFDAVLDAVEELVGPIAPPWF
jgi:hypothetical protein